MDEPRTPEWTCSEVLQLIREYGNRPALWDPDCEDYKNRCRKHQKWQELAEIFRCSRLEVERKMKILMSQYRRERHKAVKMRKMGMTHKVTWYGYKSFEFMNKQWVRYRNRSNLMHKQLIKQENMEDGDNFESSGTDLMPFLDEEEDDTQQQQDGGRMFPETYAEEKVSETLPTDQSDSVCENMVKSNQDDGIVKVLYDHKDEWALFGELVAHAFRKLPDDKTRCIVKHKINTILYEAELESYNNVSKDPK